MASAGVSLQCTALSPLNQRDVSISRAMLLISNVPRRRCISSCYVVKPMLYSYSTGSSGPPTALSDTTKLGQQLRLRRHLTVRTVNKGNLTKGCTVMRFGGGGQDKNSGEEPPETLFMKELAKRKKLGQDLGALGTDTKTKEEDTERSDKGSASSRPKFTDERDTTDQRKRSMALNSEGVDGLVPRGEELIKLGGSFWVSFWPLILASLVAFVASYLYFGPAFVHSGGRTGSPPYVDPYELLESEQLPSQAGPNRVPFNTYRLPQ